MMQWPTEHNVYDRAPMRNQFLQRHPVLIPVTFLVSSLLLCMAGAFANISFWWLTSLGIPLDMFALLCLLLAFVLGIVGTLTGITGILEQVDRSRLFTRASLLAFFRLKEQTYVNRN